MVEGVEHDLLSGHRRQFPQRRGQVVRQSRDLRIEVLCTGRDIDCIQVLTESSSIESQTTIVDFGARVWEAERVGVCL